VHFDRRATAFSTSALTVEHQHLVARIEDLFNLEPVVLKGLQKPDEIAANSLDALVGSCLRKFGVFLEPDVGVVGSEGPSSSPSPARLKASIALFTISTFSCVIARAKYSVFRLRS